MKIKMEGRAEAMVVRFACMYTASSITDGVVVGGKRVIGPTRY